MIQANANDTLAYYVRLLPAIFNAYGMERTMLKVIDCLSGEGDLVYLLMEEFDVVASNDPNPRGTSPNKFSLDDSDLWRMIRSNYNVIVTRMQSEQQISYLLQVALAYQTDTLVISVLVPATTSPHFQCRATDIEIHGFTYKWQLLFPTTTRLNNSKIRNITLHPLILESSDCVEQLVQALFTLAEIRLFQATRRFMPSDKRVIEEESVFYKEAEILKLLVENLVRPSREFPKREIIKFLGCGSYRSVQRKIRIASMGLTMPELKRLTMRSAEQQIKGQSTIINRHRSKNGIDRSTLHES